MKEAVAHPGDAIDEVGWFARYLKICESITPNVSCDSLAETVMRKMRERGESTP